MNEETIAKVLAKNKKIEQLEKVKDRIKDKKHHRLSFLVTNENPEILQYWKMEDIYTMDYISDILDHHEELVRQEIDEKICKLKKELKEL